MQEWLLHPTSTAQWQALVNEAQQRVDVSLGEEIESYLVFLLMRFSDEPLLADSVMALDFLESSQTLGNQRLLAMQDVGDKCLLFSGLFPGRALRRRVRVSYFVRIGRSAYADISSLDEQFQQLAEGFVPMMDVLQATRQSESNPLAMDLLQAEELLRDTQSVSAKQVLEQNSNGFIIHAEDDDSCKH